MVDGAVEGGAVFGGVAGWVGDDFFHCLATFWIQGAEPFATKRRVAAVRRLVDRTKR
ncbi:hypothetical protein [Pseudomonas sp. 58 R 3]|nr:hypothetical protein [Pseudomonas sp. 58 R 3]